MQNSRCSKESSGCFAMYDELQRKEKKYRV